MMNYERRRDTILCPGCGGRNEPNARECEWCGRLFVAERRSIDARWLAPVAIGGILVVMLSIVAFALVGSQGGRPAPTVPPTPIVAEGEEEAPEPAVVPPPPPVVALPPTNTAAPTETETRVEYVRIFNTGGIGAFIRREARSNAPGIVAYRDGIVLRIVGADVSAEGRVWRNVEDRQGNRGWTPREFLEPSPTGF
jgi:hypothetical protein